MKQTRVIFRRLAIALAIAVSVTAVTVSFLLLWQPRWLVAKLARRSPSVLYFVETTEPVVALTIDDGPDPETTPEILSVLGRNDVQATFFLISSQVAGNEVVVSQIIEQGHEIGNHLTRDEPSFRLSPSEFENALLEADDVLSRFAPVRWVRPASGWYNASMLSIIEAHGYKCALGSIYPYDAQIPAVDFAVSHTLRKARPGSIIVLHDGGARGRRTASVLRRILPELQGRGLRVTTLSDLVDRD